VATEGRCSFNPSIIRSLKFFIDRYYVGFGIYNFDIFTITEVRINAFIAASSNFLKEVLEG